MHTYVTSEVRSVEIQYVYTHTELDVKFLDMISSHTVSVIYMDCQKLACSLKNKEYVS